MNYATIKPLDIANGEGIRVSLFVSGCTHRCKGCFNSPAWDFNYGSPYTESVEREIAKLVEFPYVSGLSLLGGEPFEPPNQRALLSLVNALQRWMAKIFGHTRATLTKATFLKEEGRIAKPQTKYSTQSTYWLTESMWSR